LTAVTEQLLGWSATVASSASPPQPTAAPSSRRLDAVDWLRGLAVVLMIQAHGFDAWLTPEAKTGGAYWLIRHMSGLPSRLFLLLVGVTAAMGFERQLAKGVSTTEMRWAAAKRGLQIVVLAYLFRLQEHILAGFRGGWEMLARVDILNAIGASLLVVALVAVPRNGRRQIAACLLGAAVFLGLGTVIGPAHFPSWLPRPLTSYIGGQRPMSWFPLFPWGAWALLGVVLGHLWTWASRDRRTLAITFLLTGLAGVACTGTVILVRAIDPYIIRYPSDLVQQMGPGAFFYRLGIIGVLAALCWVITAFTDRRRFSPMKQLGQTSLLVYWVHVDLCYGGLARPLRGKLDVPTATIWIIGLTVLMLGLSVLKTRYAGPIGAWLRTQWRRLRLRFQQA
jgi:uncharacterized membrane protein